MFSPLPSASPSKAFSIPSHSSFNSNSLFLSDSSPPYVVIFSLVTFLLCQLPSPCSFSSLPGPLMHLLHLYPTSPPFSIALYCIFLFILHAQLPHSQPHRFSCRTCDTPSISVSRSLPPRPLPPTLLHHFNTHFFLLFFQPSCV